MKRIMSIILVFMSLVSIFSCSTKENSESSNTETNTSLETNTSTQTNTNTSTDTVDEQEPTSNLEINVIKDYGYYFELITTTHYEILKENIAQKREESGKYKIIKTYDEYLSFVPNENDIKISEDLFIDNYILAVYMVKPIDGSLRKYKTDSRLFYDMVLYEEHYRQLHEPSVDAVPETAGYYAHFRIPSYMVDDGPAQDNGKFTIESRSVTTYSYRSINLSSYPEIELKENEARFLSEEEKPSFIYPEDCAFIFNYHKEVRGLCAFRNFYVEDGTVYITMIRALPYKGNSFGTSGNETDYYYNSMDYYYDKNDTYIVTFEETMLPYDMPQNPSFNITVIEYYR